MRIYYDIEWPILKMATCVMNDAEIFMQFLSKLALLDALLIRHFFY